MITGEETLPEKKKTSTGKKLLFFIGLIVLIGVIVQVMAEAYVDTIPKQKVRDPDMVAIEIPALQLEQEFEQQTDSSIAKYKDKLLLVEGVVETVDKYHSGEAFIVFRPGKEKNPILIESLFLKDKEQLDKLKKGEQIKVKGYLEFKSDKVVLTDPKIVWSSN